MVTEFFAVVKTVNTLLVEGSAIEGKIESDSKQRLAVVANDVDSGTIKSSTINVRMVM